VSKGRKLTSKGERTKLLHSDGIVLVVGVFYRLS